MTDMPPDDTVTPDLHALDRYLTGICTAEERVEAERVLAENPLLQLATQEVGRVERFSDHDAQRVWGRLTMTTQEQPAASARIDAIPRQHSSVREDRRPQHMMARWAGYAALMVVG